MRTNIGLTVLITAVLAGCSQAPKPEAGGIRILKAGKEQSGFLKDYSKLKPRPDLDGETLTYVNPDKMKHLRRYIAVMVEPTEVTVCSNPQKVPSRPRNTSSPTR